MIFSFPSAAGVPLGPWLPERDFFCVFPAQALDKIVLDVIIDNAICGGAGIGRQARLRCVCICVWVQVPSAAPAKEPPHRGGFTFILYRRLGKGSGAVSGPGPLPSRRLKGAFLLWQFPTTPSHSLTNSRLATAIPAAPGRSGGVLSPEPRRNPLPSMPGGGKTASALKNGRRTAWRRTSPLPRRGWKACGGGSGSRGSNRP